MDILFNQSHITSYLEKITNYKNLKYRFENSPNGVIFKYLSPDIESYTTIRLMHGEGVLTVGYVVYVKLLKLDYLANAVPVGVTNSEILDIDGVGTGVQKKWVEWQPTIIQESNDGLEVIIITNINNNAATTDDLNILEGSEDLIQFMGIGGLKSNYKNNILWLLDEEGNQVVEMPIIKTANYYYTNWEKETFDFIHAKKLVAEWFNGLPGANNVEKFMSLSPSDMRDTARFGILPNTHETTLLLEALGISNNFLSALRLWGMRRAIVARTERFTVAYSYLIDNIKDLAKVDNMLTYKEQYLHYGNSTMVNNLVANETLNDAFWGLFSVADVTYTNMTLAEIRAIVLNILNGDNYIISFI